MANAFAFVVVAGAVLTGLFSFSVPAEVLGAEEQIRPKEAQIKAKEERAGDFVSISVRTPCDEVNKSLWVVNTHPYKTVKVTVRWKAANGKFTTSDFFPSPNLEFEIGCASEAEILDAQFAGF